MELYASIGDYVSRNIAPGIGDTTLTDEQAMEVARRMTSWWIDYDEIPCEGGVRYEYRSVLVERTDRNFWDEVARVLGDN